MKNLITLLCCFVSINMLAQTKKEQDIKAIKAMCGCYNISFNFAETFAPDKDYQFQDNYLSGGLEYVFPVEETNDKIVLQHLLVIGDSMIIKHWRQDWIYENMDFHMYDKDNTWKYESKPSEMVQGQWSQKVFQVDDGPRYEGSATWVHVDGKHYWENTTDAPLPRREFSKRDDYNVMVRRNRHEIVENGWVHEQDNNKVIRKDGKDQVLAMEKGWNSYTKTDESKCQLAKDWWEGKHVYWDDVRAVWDQLFASRQDFSIKKKVDDKVLFMKLFELEDELLAGKKYNSRKAQKQVKEIIEIYLVDEIEWAINNLSSINN